MATPQDDPNFDRARYDDVSVRVNLAMETANIASKKVDVTLDGITVVITAGMTWAELDAAVLYLYYKGEIPSA